MSLFRDGVYFMAYRSFCGDEFIRRMSTSGGKFYWLKIQQYLEAGFGYF
jgi:hypothetical protein